MKITELLDKNSILLGGMPKDKSEAIDRLTELQAAGGKISDKKEYRKKILEREELSSTAVGDGIAIPHAKSGAVTAPSLAAMTVPQGVDYGSMDGEPSRLLFMIAAPDDGETHLEVLSRLMTLLMDDELREKLIYARDKESFLNIIDEAEKKRFPDENKVEAPAENTHYRVLAVTACPTGIAHTYMAAEALEKAAKRLGVTIKVETNGSGGAKNILTDDEIAACDGIIIAADKTVDMSRFDGKKLISVRAADGIKVPDTLISRITAGNASVYHHAGTKASEASYGGDNFGRRLYKHLMNGVSNMLPFTVAGGIFIALAFLIDSLSGAPQDSSFGSHTAAAGFLNTMGGFAFSFMVPVLAGYIGKSIADRPGFLAGFVGGWLAETGSTFADTAGAVPSGFLGALLAGFAGGYIMLGIEKLCEGIPKALNGIKPVLIYPLSGLGIISLLMCAVNPFMGMLSTGLYDMLNTMGNSSRIALGFVLGAMMSVDMGGPFNKAAYVFGTAAIAGGRYDIMAAVMAGGMVPPIAIALATTFFKSRWTAEERRNGAVNYIMGLSFITEGAIPYAAADPFRVIPACLIGAGTAGGLSMALGCTLMAPHGGIFVLPVIGNSLMYLAALTAGSVVGMIFLAVFKKKAV